MAHPWHVPGMLWSMSWLPCLLCLPSRSSGEPYEVRSVTFDVDVDYACGGRETLVFYPTGAGPFPVVAYGHGAGGRDDVNSCLHTLSEVASHGLVVVAPMTGGFVEGDPNSCSSTTQYQDIFEVLKYGKAKGYGGDINATFNASGLWGWSMGGKTLGIGLEECLSNETCGFNVGAVVASNGARSSQAVGDTPSMLLTCQNDWMSSPALTMYEEFNLVPAHNKVFVNLAGAGHEELCRQERGDLLATWTGSFLRCHLAGQECERIYTDSPDSLRRVDAGVFAPVGESTGLEIVGKAPTITTTTTTTTTTSTADGPGPSPSASAVPSALVIHGAGAANGYFKLGGNVSGQPSWTKVTDATESLAYSEGAWYLHMSRASNRSGAAGARFRGKCSGASCLPTDVTSWDVSNAGSWRRQDSTKVKLFTETFSSDWLSPTLSLLAVVAAILSASAGSVVTSASRHTSLQGVWFGDEARYEIVTSGSSIPQLLCSLLSIAFPVPVGAIGESQLCLKSGTNPEPPADFVQVGALWQSSDGAKLRRLGGDMLELAPPARPAQQLRRAFGGKREAWLLPTVWVLQACLWLRPPVGASFAAIYLLAGVLHLSAACCTRPEVRLPPWASLLRAVLAVLPLCVLVALDLLSDELSGSVLAGCLLGLHALSLSGPRLMMAARESRLVAALLGAWLLLALGGLAVLVPSLAASSASYALVRSKASVALAGAGAWLAVPLQIGSGTPAALERRPPAALGKIAAAEALLEADPELGLAPPRLGKLPRAREAAWEASARKCPVASETSSSSFESSSVEGSSSFASSQSSCSDASCGAPSRSHVARDLPAARSGGTPLAGEAALFQQQVVLPTGGARPPSPTLAEARPRQIVQKAAPLASCSLGASSASTRAPSPSLHGPWHGEGPGTEAGGLFPGAQFRFVRRTDYHYNPHCVHGATVTLVRLGGQPPALVRWPSGFMYWVNGEDLEELSAPLSDAETSPSSQLGLDDIPNVSFDNDASQKCSLTRLRQVEHMPDMPRSSSLQLGL